MNAPYDERTPTVTPSPRYSGYLTSNLGQAEVQANNFAWAGCEPRLAAVVS